MAALVICLCLIAAVVSCISVTYAARADENYEVSEIESLPADWELSSLCDVDNVATSYRSGAMVITSKSAALNTKYYGALYRIAKDKSYSDFTFEIVLRMDAPSDSDRWLGIMYRAAEADNGNLMGYLLNYRYSGFSATSAVTSSKAFKDDEKKDAGVPLSDGAFHTITVTMNGNNATHFIDGKVVSSWNVTSKNSSFGGKPLNEGSFALIVNRSTVTVKSVKIIPEPQTPALNDTEKDSVLAKTYTAQSKLIGEPTVICDVTDESIYNSLLSSEATPSNAIFSFNKSQKAVDANGKAIGSFYDIYKSLDHKIIPIVRISDKAEADAFIDFMENSITILDIAVMSDKPGLVDAVRLACPSVRGIVEYKDIPASLYDIVKEATSAKAQTVILPQSAATVENVLYLQARFKTVWVRAESTSFGDYSQCINSGAYGVVSTDFGGIYDAVNTYNGYVRNIFNVAHRGLPEKYNENSLSGIEAAIRAGATHVELDGHLTKDKRIVVIHDDTIDSTTNGHGVISDMTLEQILSYDLNRKAPDEKIPTLEQVVDLIKKLNAELNKDVVLVFEIKDDQPDFVKYMKEIFDGKDFYENLVIITFDGTENQLCRLNEQVPWVPTALLDGVTQTALPTSLAMLSSKNTGIDFSTSCYDDDYNKMLRDRGFTDWYWTFGTAGAVRQASKEGYLGVTNNAGDCFGKNVRYVYGTDVAGVKNESDVPSTGDTVTLRAKTYEGEEYEVEGTVYYTEEIKGGWRVFATYTQTVDGYERTVYVQGINYYKPASLWWISLIVVGAVLLAGGVTAAIIIVKKRKKK